MSSIKDLCKDIRFHMTAMGPPDGDASWYKDNAHRIALVLEEVKLLISQVDPQEDK